MGSGGVEWCMEGQGCVLVREEGGDSEQKLASIGDSDSGRRAEVVVGGSELIVGGSELTSNGLTS